MTVDRGASEPGARLLVVDDEPSYRDYLERYLARLGYEVRTAANGTDALAIADDFRPQVVLVDWMLKDSMNGLEVGERIREGQPGTRVLLMTGFPSSEIREEAERAQVFRFLEKPFSLETVATAIASAIAEGNTPE